jgi:hypothetical protein
VRWRLSRGRPGKPVQGRQTSAARIASRIASRIDGASLHAGDGRAGVKAGTTVVSDGGSGIGASAEQPGIVHQRHVTGSDHAAARHPAFRWAKTVLANVKNSLLATHRAVGAKHRPRRLAPPLMRFTAASY